MWRFPRARMPRPPPAAATCTSPGRTGRSRSKSSISARTAGPGHIDLSAQAFARIAPLVAGLAPVTYQTIADPPLPAPLALRVKEGSNPYWLAPRPAAPPDPAPSC